MRLELRLSNLMRCSSQNPSSRRRLVISGDAESCLILTETPGWTSLNWQSGTEAPLLLACVDVVLSTLRVKLKALRLSCKRGIEGASNQ